MEGVEQNLSLGIRLGLHVLLCHGPHAHRRPGHKLEEEGEASGDDSGYDGRQVQGSWEATCGCMPSLSANLLAQTQSFV